MLQLSVVSHVTGWSQARKFQGKSEAVRYMISIIKPIFWLIGAKFLIRFGSFGKPQLIDTWFSFILCNIAVSVVPST